MGSRSLVLLAVLVAAGCSAGRNRGETCSVTTDCQPDLVCQQSKCSDLPAACGVLGVLCPLQPGCCDGLTCQGGICKASCAAMGKACVLSTSCCAGLICQNKICAKPPTGAMCGNKRCEAGENQTNCCSDCGCPAGTACQANVCKATATVLNWTVTNNCRNGEDIVVRFFAVDRGLEWPGGDQVYESRQGSTWTQNLACVPGEKICLGAWQPDHDLSWGVGIENTDDCTGCCRTCANTSTSDTLTCP